MFVHRSQTALNIGPLRQYGVQLQTFLLDKRIHLTTGIFNGGTEETPKISLAVGKINTTPVLGDIGGTDIRIDLGGSAAYTQKEADFPNYIFIEKNHFLYGLHTSMMYGALWLESEYDAASSDNQKTIEGFYCDLGFKISRKWEAAGVSTGWSAIRSISPIMSRDILRKYMAGANWYPIDRIKIQFNLEREEGITDIHTGYINVQYAINYE